MSHDEYSDDTESEDSDETGSDEQTHDDGRDRTWTVPVRPGRRKLLYLLAVVAAGATASFDIGNWGQSAGPSELEVPGAEQSGPNGTVGGPVGRTPPAQSRGYGNGPYGAGGYGE